MYQLQTKACQPIDAVWFGKLTEILKTNAEVFQLLEPSPPKLAQERRAFEAANFKYVPDLAPDTIPVAQYRDSIQRLATLMRQVADEPAKAVREAYISRISEYITQYELVLAAADQDAYSFGVANSHMYGLPAASLFQATCQWVIQNAETRFSAQLSGYQRAVLRVVPRFAGADLAQLFPSRPLFEAVRQLHFAEGGYIDQLFSNSAYPQTAYVEQAAGDEMCQLAIRNIGSRFGIGASEDGIWAVDRSRQLIVRPDGYRLDADEYRGIICHEVGSHLLESVNGAKQPLRLLGLGLDRYESGNEGRAYLREQIMYQSVQQAANQSSWEYIILLYLGVCLAAGLHDHPYDFVELYDLFYCLHRFWRERRFPMSTNNELSARQESWNLAVRIMKGRGPGMASATPYLKDIVYLQGNVACWQAAAANPELILLGDSGKFDITNPEHLAILRQLTIM